ncbi:MAG: hypothetical protein H7A24_08105 [Leptospiraceae bacterium]|nr:cysteine rich repeat-containing protein [Leptospiraceae bacterium]MCP5511829.1 hypothetical protein [Leptospiraceae bacterium]
MKNILLVLFAFFMFSGLSADFTKGACKEDTKKYCPDLKGKDRGLCMKKNYNSLSKACKKNMDYFKNRGKQILKACKRDLDKHCNTVLSGEGKKLKCLRDNSDKISDACNKAIAIK